jgi:hypothetical protein
MISPQRFALSRVSALAVSLGLVYSTAWAQTSRYPVTEKQRSTATQVAQQGGVPLSELRPNAPDSYRVKKGDTLWDISKLFLKSPWRWPELWGMNFEEIKNPHLIYPGQMLYLDKQNGRARLRVGKPVLTNQEKLQPSVRSSELGDHIPAVPMAQIEPFLNEAVIFETDELMKAPRVVATQEGRVMLSRGDLAYVRGDLSNQSNFRVFRQLKPLLDPTTKKILGYEGVYLGSVELLRKGNDMPFDAKTTAKTTTKGVDIIPDTFTVTQVRQEIAVGDRLAPVPERDFSSYVPRAPQNDIEGQVASTYGESVTVGQNQIVTLNRGKQDGLEPGHILALWRDGRRTVDKTYGKAEAIKLPNEQQGTLFVFRVFNQMSYALILSVDGPVNVGDRFTQP